MSVNSYMKPRLLSALAILVVLVVFAFGYGYFSGRVLLLRADTHTKIEVNGALVPGEMLVGRATAIITTREGRHHSYQLFFEGDTDSTGDMGFVVDCGTWVAPLLPILPETRGYPPCGKANALPDAWRWRLIDKGQSMQFNLEDHSVVAIRRSRY